MGNSTISMAIFNSYVKLPEGNQKQGSLLQETARQLRQRQDVCGVLAQLPCQDGHEAVAEEGNGEGRTQPEISIENSIYIIERSIYIIEIYIYIYIYIHVYH